MYPHWQVRRICCSRCMESCQLQVWRLELCGVAYASGHPQLSAGCTCCWDSCSRLRWVVACLQLQEPNWFVVHT